MDSLVIKDVLSLAQVSFLKNFIDDFVHEYERADKYRHYQIRCDEKSDCYEKFCLDEENELDHIRIYAGDYGYAYYWASDDVMTNYHCSYGNDVVIVYDNEFMLEPDMRLDALLYGKDAVTRNLRNFNGKRIHDKAIAWEAEHPGKDFFSDICYEGYHPES